MTPAQWRKKNHYTKRQLASWLGVKQDTLRKYLRGVREWPLHLFWRVVQMSKGHVTMQDTVAEWTARRAVVAEAWQSKCGPSDGPGTLSGGPVLG